MIRGTIGTGAPRSITVRAYELLGAGGSEGLHTTGLVPVYAATEALPSVRIRELVDLARGFAVTAPEVLPAWIRDRLGLMSYADALMCVHFPRGGRRRPPGASAAGASRSSSSCSWACWCCAGRRQPSDPRHVSPGPASWRSWCAPACRSR